MAQILYNWDYDTNFVLFLAGIAAIRDEFAANSRQNPVAKIGWLITKGPSPYGMLVQVHARAAAEEGIELLFLGVGQMVDMPNLMAIQTSFQVSHRCTYTLSHMFCVHALSFISRKLEVHPKLS